MTESALVQRPNFPESGNVLSWASMTFFPSKDTWKWSPLASTDRSCQTPLAFAVPASELDSPAFHHVVKAYVALECVGAGDVIVVRILQPEDEPASLVDLSGDGLAFH
jgi:hypothetical protein